MLGQIIRKLLFYSVAILYFVWVCFVLIADSSACQHTVKSAGVCAVKNKRVSHYSIDFMLLY